MNKLLVSLLLLAFTPHLLNAQALSEEDFSKLMDSYLKDDDNVAKVSNRIESYFRKKQQKDQADRAKKEEAAMADQIANPLDVEVGDSPFRGPEDAEIVVFEFSDFQCPFCARGADTVKQLEKEYPGKVKLVFKNLPLGFHPQAKPAAKAALAANDQGKFFEMKTALFKNQQKLGEKLYPKLAEEIGLDVDKFKADYASGKYDELIDADTKLARELGISGTPGFVVNGVLVKGARPLPYFKEIISKTLKK